MVSQELDIYLKKIISNEDEMKIYQLLIIIIIALGGCKLIYVDLFDSNNAKIELFNKIINNPEEMDSIIKKSKFYDEKVSNYFFKNKSVLSVIKFLEKNKGKKISLFYNKKFSIIRYPVQGVYKDGKESYLHEISYIYDEDKNTGLTNVILIRYELNGSKWCFKALSILNKDELERLY